MTKPTTVSPITPIIHMMSRFSMPLRSAFVATCNLSTCTVVTCTLVNFGQHGRPAGMIRHTARPSGSVAVTR